MRLDLYATRPVERPAPVAYDGTVTDRQPETDGWLIDTYDFGAQHALYALLFHAEQRTVKWLGRGWRDVQPPTGLCHELRDRDEQNGPSAVARVTADNQLLIAEGFILRLPHHSIQPTVSTYITNMTVLTGREPARTATLTPVPHAGEYLPAKETSV